MDDPGAPTPYARLAGAVIKQAVEELPPARLRAWLREDVFEDWCLLANCNPDRVRAGLTQIVSGRRRPGLVILQLSDDDAQL